MKNTLLKDNSGIALLIIVLIISAISILLATTAGFTGIDAIQTGLRQDTNLEVFVETDGCMEVALKKIHDNYSYVGETLNLNLNGTICTITITGSGTARTVTARTSREIQANVDWSVKYKIISWQEITN